MNEQNSNLIPEGEATSAFSEWGGSENPEGEGDLSHLPPAHRDVVRRLYRKVRQAAVHIKRLEEENEQLREQVSELENRPAISSDKTALAVDADPGNLREQISSFIEAIDTYLDEGSSETTAAQSASESTP